MRDESPREYIGAMIRRTRAIVLLALVAAAVTLLLAGANLVYPSPLFWLLAVAVHAGWCAGAIWVSCFGGDLILWQWFRSRWPGV